MADGRAVLEAREPFSIDMNGAPFQVRAGDRFYADDPVVEAAPALFTELTVRTSRGQRPQPTSPTGSAVETTTAEPGGRRRLSRPAGKPPAEPVQPPQPGEV